jgi:hypothetical protein
VVNVVPREHGSNPFLGEDTGDGAEYDRVLGITEHDLGRGERQAVDLNLRGPKWSAYLTRLIGLQLTA